MQGISSSGSGGAQLSSGSFSSFSQSPSPSSTPQNAGSLSVSDYQSLTSPGSIEVSSDPVFQINGKDHNGSVAGTGELGGSTELEVSHALRKLEEQLSLNDDSFKELSPPCNQVEEPNDLDLLEYKQVMLNQDQFAHFRGTENAVRDQCYSGHVGLQGNTNHSMLLRFRWSCLFSFFWCIEELKMHLLVDVIHHFWSFCFQTYDCYLNNLIVIGH